MDYFSADFHLGDERFALFPRPFSSAQACREHIIEQHASKLKAEDTLYLIGDVALDTMELVHLARIPGKKVLIRGNYDRLVDAQYLQYFNAVHDFLDLTLKHKEQTLDVRLNHYPSKSVTDRFNLVGHIHGTWRVQKNMLNVGVDVNFFQPFDTPLVFHMFNAIDKVYDEDVWCGNHVANTTHQVRGKKGAAAPGTFKL